MASDSEMIAIELAAPILKRLVGWAPPVVVAFAVLSLSGCAGSKVRAQDEASGKETPSEVFGPKAPEGSAAAADSYGPEPFQVRPLVVILGPGLARGYAHAGVLRALEQEKIPIAGVFGTEMGAWVGGVYAASRSIHEFEFLLMRFRPSAFSRPQGLLSGFGSGENRGGELEDSLEKALGSKEFKETRVPLHLLAQKKSGRVSVIDSGRISRAIRASIGVPGWMSASEHDGELTRSSGSVRAFPIQEARAWHPQLPILVVDVSMPIPKNDPVAGPLFADIAVQARALGQQPEITLRPRLDSVGPWDFERRNEALFAGKAAVKEQLVWIKRVVGMP